MKGNSRGMDAGEGHFKGAEANSGCSEAKGSASRYSDWTPTDKIAKHWDDYNGGRDVPYAAKCKLSFPCGPLSNFVFCKGTSRNHALALRVVIKRDDPPKCWGMIVLST
jgi:hypothetical protein